MLSGLPTFTVLCCQLRAFRLAYFHCAMLPTPCFSSGAPKFNALSCQPRAFMPTHLHRVTLQTPCFSSVPLQFKALRCLFRSTYCHDVMLPTPCFGSGSPTCNALCSKLHVFRSTDFHSVTLQTLCFSSGPFAPQWGTADAEIKDPSVQNAELKGSPFKVWSRSELISTFPVCSSAFSSKTSPELFLC